VNLARAGLAHNSPIFRLWVRATMESSTTPGLALDHPPRFGLSLAHAEVPDRLAAR